MSSSANSFEMWNPKKTDGKLKKIFAKKRSDCGESYSDPELP